VLGGLGRATRVGAAPAGAVRTVGIFLNRPNPAGEQRLYQAMYDPASLQYHRFLSPAAFAARFAVPAAQMAATESWLRAGGLTIEAASGAAGYLTAQGTVGALDRLFRVSVGRYHLAGVSFVANDRAPSVPAALPIEAVVGLDSLHRFSVPRAALPDGRALLRGGGARPASGTFSGVLTPADLWKLYDQPATDQGQGQTVGMFGEGDAAPVVTNLRLFEQHYGLPRVPVRIVHTEPGPAAAYGDESGAIEWYLDTQAITGMAPKVSRLDMYFSKGLADADVYASFSKWATDPQGPAQMNASFGECETDPLLNPVAGPLAQQPYGSGLGDDLEVQLGGEQILRQAALEGRTLFAATGDTGSGCDEAVAPVAGAGNGVVIQPVPEVGYPAASQYAVAVGGTVVNTDGANHGQRQSEVSWTYTGGGASYFISEPSFQKKVANVNQDCLFQPDGTSYSTPTVCRGVPDIAALSGNILGNGYSIYIDGNLSSEGGTSLSTPLSVGMWARIQAAAAARSGKGHRAGLGFADPSLYTAARTPGTFYDVTQSETPVGNGAYAPGPGWDYTSGLGVPDVSKLISVLVGRMPKLPAPATAVPGPAAVCQATVTSPAGNATDPVDVQLGNDAGLDITSATLSATSTQVVATITGPAVTAANPASGTSGRDLYVLWSSGTGGAATERFLQAHFDSAGLVTVTSGSSTGQDSAYSYTPSTSTAATYTISGSTLTIRAPASELGRPTTGSRLSYPFAISQDDVGTPDAAGSPFLAEALTADAAALPVPATAVDQGQAVVVGGCRPAPAAKRVAPVSSRKAPPRGRG
jgi:subtilase family serine protease